MAPPNKPWRQVFRDAPPSTLMWRGCGFALTCLINRWMSTLNYRIAYYDETVEPVSANFRGPNIYLFWHEYIPFPLHLRPRCRLAMLLSKHQDAELLSHVAHFSGMDTVRGSTHRGGTTALREMLEQGRGKSLAITPDGPRGPRRVLAQGCIYLSSRLQVPLVPLGFGYDRPWRHPTAWDRFAFPRLFSRARAVSGPRIQIPSDLDREQIERYRVWVEQVLNQLTRTAENWAAGEYAVVESRTIYRQAARIKRDSGAERFTQAELWPQTVMRVNADWRQAS